MSHIGKGCFGDEVSTYDPIQLPDMLSGLHLYLWIADRFPSEATRGQGAASRFGQVLGLKSTHRCDCDLGNHEARLCAACEAMLRDLVPYVKIERWLGTFAARTHDFCGYFSYRREARRLHRFVEAFPEVIGFLTASDEQTRKALLDFWIAFDKWSEAKEDGGSRYIHKSVHREYWAAVCYWLMRVPDDSVVLFRQFLGQLKATAPLREQLIRFALHVGWLRFLPKAWQARLLTVVERSRALKLASAWGTVGTLAQGTQAVLQTAAATAQGTKATLEAVAGRRHSKDRSKEALGALVPNGQWAQRTTDAAPTRSDDDGANMDVGAGCDETGANRQDLEAISPFAPATPAPI